MRDPVLDTLVVVRWVHFVAIFAIFGGALFWLTAGRLRCADLPASVARTAAGIEVSAWVAAFSGLGWVAATIANMTGDFDGLLDGDTMHAFFLETAFGPIEVARLTLLAALVVLSRRRPAPFAGLATLSCVLLVSQAWLGHAAEGGSTWHGVLMVGSYAGHVLGAAAWLGGLPALLLALRETLSGGHRAAAAGLLLRFSAMALVAVAVVVASGLANTSFHVHRWGRLVGSAYGDVLAVKLTLVTAMLTIAAFNRFVAVPRLRRGRAAVGLVPLLAVEVALAALVLAAAARLGITPPPG